jgi:hypothetical protein
MGESVDSAPRLEELRRGAMRRPEEVAAMLRLKELGWGVRRIAATLGCSHTTVRRYLGAGAGCGTRRRGGRGRWTAWGSGWRSGGPVSRVGTGPVPDVA